MENGKLRIEKHFQLSIEKKSDLWHIGYKQEQVERQTNRLVGFGVSFFSFFIFKALKGFKGLKGIYKKEWNKQIHKTNNKRQANKGKRRMPALGGDEGRDKLRKAGIRCK